MFLTKTMVKDEESPKQVEGSPEGSRMPVETFHGSGAGSASARQLRSKSCAEKISDQVDKMMEKSVGITAEEHLHRLLKEFA